MSFQPRKETDCRLAVRFFSGLFFQELFQRGYAHAKRQNPHGNPQIILLGEGRSNADIAVCRILGIGIGCADGRQLHADRGA